MRKLILLLFCFSIIFEKGFGVKSSQFTTLLSSLLSGNVQCPVENPVSVLMNNIKIGDLTPNSLPD